MTNSERLALRDLGYDRSLGLFDCIARVRDIEPDHPALICGDQVVTYRELLDDADRVAARLIAVGVRHGDLVALVGGRSIATTVTMLGILRAGAGYVPIDPAYDAERLSLIINDTRPAAILWLEPFGDLAQRLAGCDGATRAPILPVAQLVAPGAPVASDPPKVSGGDTACILYTSGSTGRPKGVVLPQRAITRLAYDQPAGQILASDRVLHAATVAADCSLYECWVTLCLGATLVILDQPKPAVDLVAAELVGRGVTMAFFYTGLFHLVAEHALESLGGLRMLVAGGDVMSPVMSARVMRAHPSIRLCNLYGPTEDTVYSTIYEIRPEDLDGRPIPIGLPEPHGECLVVDEALNEVADGEIGQLLVTGDGLADGYLNLPEQTAERFIPDPRPGATGRAYMTGDLVRRRANGVFDFFGRVDRQVKIGGRRIELDEIEHDLRALPMLADAAVAMVDLSPDDHRIGAFLRPEGPMPADERAFLRAVRAELAKVLPEAMHPRHYRVMAEFPLTENGKVDRKALVRMVKAEPPDMATPDLPEDSANAPPAPAEPATPAVRALSASEVRGIIADLWHDMLHCGPLDGDSTFFEAGGTSLQLIEAHARLEERFGFHFDLTLMFETARLADLSRELAALSTSDTARPWAPKAQAEPPKAACAPTCAPTCAPADAPAAPAEPAVHRIDHHGAIAIVGMAARLPESDSLAAFWDHLRAGRNLIRRFAPDEIEDGFTPEERARPTYVPARPWLNDVDQFDAKFFKLYPREAAEMDPQGRVFLEICHEALENAGHDPRRFGGPIGVFAGSSMPTYLMRHVLGSGDRLEDFTANYQVGNYTEFTGNLQDSLATRVAFKLDLHGPAYTVQTACSTSLTAISQAVINLRAGQCDMALAGGVSITFPQKRGYFSLDGGIVSADGVCRPFDEGANGTVFGHGAGVVVLRRLEDALADGDHIHAVIRGVGVNNDGSDKIAYTAPSVAGQAGAIRAALEDAGLTPDGISYVECHGTATPLGDPVELRGLASVFGAGGGPGSCAIGSVKGNLGHLDAAAGVVGVIKTALMLTHGEIPAVANFTRLNPKIDLNGTPFRVQDRTAPWVATGPRRAGVSSFGVGGTNVHVVMEEAPPPAHVETPETVQILPVSARSAEALATLAARLADAVGAADAPPLADAAFTLQEGRTAHEFRAAVAARTGAEAAAALRGLSAPRAAISSEPPAIAFMFPGQGSQYPGMGSGLYRSEPEFARWIDLGAEIARPLLGLNINDLLCFGDVSDEAAARALRDTRLTQPALYMIQFACAKLWESRGIRPDAMIGHSVGEFAAAALAGVFDFETGLRLIAARGRLMQDQPPGTMLSVRAPLERLQPFLDGSVDLAAQNAPQLNVLAGDGAAIAAMAARLEAAGIPSSPLHTSHAFHSRMMDPVCDALAAEIAGLSLQPPTIPYVSCVTGDWITPAEATDPAYWARQARQAVLFADGITRLVAARPTILVETGAGGVLSAFAAQTLPRTGHAGIVSSLPDHRREVSDDVAMASALGRIWSLGHPVDWARSGPRGARRVPLPGYPFERKRCWIDPPARAGRDASAPSAPASTLAPQPLPAPEAAPVNAAPAVVPFQSQESPAMTLPAAADRKPRLTTEILALLADLSGEELGPDDAAATFLELGFDSLFLGQVSQRLGADYGVSLTFRQLLSDYPSTLALVDHLDATLPPEPAAAPQPVAAPAAAAPAVAVAAAAAAPVPAAPLALPVSATVAAPMAPVTLQVPGDGLTGVMQAQINALQSIFAQQMAVLTGQPAMPAVQAAPAPVQHPPAAAAPAPATAPAPASVPAPVAARSEAAPPAPPAAEDATPPARPAFSFGRAAVAVADLTDEQKAYAQDLCRRYSARSPKSKAYCDRYRPVLADPRTAAGFRAEWKELVYPVVADRSKGARIWDIDGNEYIDLVNGFGQTAFGHSPDFVIEAVNRQMEKGFAIGPQSDMAGPVAERFARMVGHERVTFCNTGSEAVMAAMRLARAVTGRETIVVFSNDYHGQFDEVLVKGKQKTGDDPAALPIAPGIPRSGLGNMKVLPYAADETLDWLRRNAGSLAAVLVEPVQSRHPELRPAEFVREVRRITEAAGVAMVMDEVVTGFRVGPKGMQGEWGIAPDMATYGKVVGGGMPVGMLAGKRRFMDALDGGTWRFGDESIPQTAPTFFAGTFVRHPLVLAAVDATLDHIERHGPDLWGRVAQRTGALVEELNAILAARGLPRLVEGYSSWMIFNLANHDPNAALLFPLLRMRGVHVQVGYMAMFTTAHSEEDFRAVARAFTEAVDELQSVGILRPAGAVSATASVAPAAPIAAAVAAPAAPLPVAVPLTEAQREIWMISQLGDEPSCAFNESSSMRLEGALDTAALERALARVIARHDGLRQKFARTGETFDILAPFAPDLPLIDLSGEADPEAALTEVLAEDAGQPIDLVEGPPFRTFLVRLSDRAHVLVMNAHHIVCDGWSYNVIFRDLAAFYSEETGHGAASLPPAPSFADHARAVAGAEPRPEVRAFWRGVYHDLPDLPELPADRPRGAVKSYAGATCTAHVDGEVMRAARKAGAKAGCTLFSTLFAALQVVISRLTGSSDIVLGVPTGGQSLLPNPDLVGHCVNFLPIRAPIDANDTMAEHLARVGRTVMNAFDHQDYTYGTMVRDLGVERSLNRLPLTEIQFNLEKLADGLQMGGLQAIVHPNAKRAVNFDLFVNVVERKDGLRIDVDYNRDLYDAATVERWIGHLDTVLREMAAGLDRPVASFPILTTAETGWLSGTVNATRADYPRDALIHDLVAEVARTNPDRIAIEDARGTVSYGALMARVDAVAAAVQAALPAPGGRVAVAMQRTSDTIVALLGVMKAGHAYVPMDPTQPEARLRAVLAASRADAILHDAPAAPAFAAGSAARLIAMTGLAEGATPAPVRHGANPSAYVIFTSGSTGTPKGVEVGHRQVVNLLTSMAREPGFGANDALLAVTTKTFDISVLEFFLPLIRGGKVIMATKGDVLGGFKLVERIDRGDITHMQATPTLWAMLLEAGLKPRPGLTMFCGGEPMPADLAERLLAGGGALWNLYGPTETTIWSAVERVRPGDRITIGHPIANTELHVLGPDEDLLPIGAAGELWIGGDGLAKGYFDRPDLTAAAFRDVTVNGQARKLYRTGDIARRLADGRIAVLGRRDDQIKLRGFRIEMGEIETALRGVAGVEAAAVALRPSPRGGQQLVGYVVADRSRAVEGLAIGRALSGVLPDYMVPTAWVMLSDLPKTANGKLDRKALPAPEATATVLPMHTGATTETERRLAEIWENVLGIENISTTATLYALGADSLTVFRIAARMIDAGLNLEAKDLLQYPSIASLAAYADARGSDAGPSKPTLRAYRAGAKRGI